MNLILHSEVKPQDYSKTGTRSTSSSSASSSPSSSTSSSPGPSAPLCLAKNAGPSPSCPHHHGHHLKNNSPYDLRPKNTSSSYDIGGASATLASLLAPTAMRMAHLLDAQPPIMNTRRRPRKSAHSEGKLRLPM